MSTISSSVERMNEVAKSLELPSHSTKIGNVGLSEPHGILKREKVEGEEELEQLNCNDGQGHSDTRRRKMDSYGSKRSGKKISKIENEKGGLGCMQCHRDTNHMKVGSKGVCSALNPSSTDAAL